MNIKNERKNEIKKELSVSNYFSTETLSDKAINRICNSRAQNVNSKTKFPMLNATVEILSDFYRPYNEDLAALLQDDRFLWLD